MAIHALSFDADQTLWDYRHVHQIALGSTIDLMDAERIIAPGTATPEELQRIREVVADEYRGRPHSLEDVRRESFVRFLQTQGHPTPEATGRRLAEHFLAARFDHIQLYPDVAPVLGRLKTRYRIGLLTNGNSYPDLCGLPDTFDAEVMGPSYGFEKPDLVAFTTLAGLLGVDLGSIVHIGDDWDDIEGANRAGCISVLIDRERRRPDFAVDADHSVADLGEFEVLLNSLE